MEENQNNISTSLYDMNKGIIKQMRVLNSEEIADKKKEIRAFIKAMCNTFFMLLCRELNYYTLFKVENNMLLPDTVEDVIFELIEEFGDIHSVFKDKDHIELWVENKETNEMNAFMFFPYDAGVIACR